MLLVANVHEKSEKRRRAEPAADGFEHRCAVQTEAAQVKPFDQ